VNRVLFHVLALLMAATIMLAGCVPVTPAPAAESGAGSSVSAAPSDTAIPAPTQAVTTTVETAAMAEITSTVTASESAIASSTTMGGLRVNAAALAQPTALAGGRYFVGTLEVTGPGIPKQTLDVVMDRPNTEWVQMPIGTDDLNFDGRPDLVVRQPVGAKWGRLHTWLYDTTANRFVTGTLTSELALLPVGNYGVDLATKTLHITNTIGMTPFEAVYKTADGYLMPVFPPAVPADAGKCAAEAPGKLLLREELHDFCLLYPEGFEVQRPIADEVVVAVPGSMGHPPMAIIRVNVMGEKTVDQIADDMLAPFAELTPTAGNMPVQIHRGHGTLDGEPAVLLEGMPGQDLGRVVLVGHRGHLYELTFVPASRDDEAFMQMEALWAAVASSFRFLPPDAPS
jgi:hypothetical protein